MVLGMPFNGTFTRRFRLGVLYLALVLGTNCLISRTAFATDSDLRVSNEDVDSRDSFDEESKGEEYKEFTYRLHPDDHSVYAHRSLISASKVKHRESESAEEGSLVDDDDNPLKSSDFAEKEWQLMFRSFDTTYDGGSNSILTKIVSETNLFEDIVSRLKPQCKRDMYHIRDSMKKHKLWALRMIDSNGKLPSGISYGKFSSPGDYEECLSVNVDELVYRGSINSTKNSPTKYKFHGKYCLLDFRLPMPERPRNKLLSIHDSVVDLSKTELNKQFPILANYSGYASVLYEIGYLHAFCIPSTCDVMDVAKAAGQALEGLHIIVNNTIDCEERHVERQPLRTSQLISLALLVVLLVNATIASIIQFVSPPAISSPPDQQTGVNRHENEKFHARVKADIQKMEDQRRRFNLKRWASDLARKYSFYKDCFSVQSNFERLTKPDPRGLTFVHYTRIVAMALTVITHTGALGTLQAITKPADASNSEQIFRDFLPQMLANAFTSIQIFFFMAGFMLVVSTYPSIKRDKGNLSFLEYATKRAIRLMPGLAATICLNFLWPLVVDGPMLTYFIRMIVVPCEENWWRTMGFMSNFDHVEKMCLRHSYFSASDYQLHIMAFPLLILLYSKPFLSLTIAGILTLAGFVAQVIMVLTKTLLPFMMVDYMDKEAFFNVVHYIHHPVWNHMSAFFYGFFMGYLVIKRIRVNWSEKTIKTVWFTLVPLGVASIFAPYIWNHYKIPIYRWQMVIYVLVDRFILLSTCAWLSYASMVLAQKKPASKATVNQPPKVANLPEIVSLESSKPMGDINETQVQIRTPEQKVDAQAKQRSTLQVEELPTSLPRQRSSPNFHHFKTMDPIAENSAPLRPAVSGTDLERLQSIQLDTGGNLDKQVLGRPAESGHHQPASEKKRPQRAAPISNVNTLCLVLSRLTFQLYLFNMVILWIDVNHSKYYWFFSYYFIIVKAAAIYIVSSLCATVFFVLLESPCLTLYIVWVSSRAKARAKAAQRTGNGGGGGGGGGGGAATMGNDDGASKQRAKQQDHEISRLSSYIGNEASLSRTGSASATPTNWAPAPSSKQSAICVDMDWSRPKSAEPGAPLGSLDLSLLRAGGKTKSTGDQLDTVGIRGSVADEKPDNVVPVCDTTKM